MPSPSDYAYAAGVLDSDGCIGIGKEARTDKPHPYYFRVNVRVAQTELGALIWFKETFGGNVYAQNKPTEDRPKICYCWQTRKRSVIEALLKGILPYLKIKKAQAETCLSFYKHVVNHRPIKKITLFERQIQEVLCQKAQELNTCHKTNKIGGS
jgi:hypothetical protein